MREEGAGEGAVKRERVGNKLIRKTDKWKGT